MPNPVSNNQNTNGGANLNNAPAKNSANLAAPIKISVKQGLNALHEINNQLGNQLGKITHPTAQARTEDNHQNNNSQTQNLPVKDRGGDSFKANQRENGNHETQTQENNNSRGNEPNSQSKNTPAENKSPDNLPPRRDSQSSENAPNNVVRSTVRQILQQQNIYLNGNALNSLLAGKNPSNGNQKTLNLPPEIIQSVRNLTENSVPVLSGSKHNAELTAFQNARLIPEFLHEDVQVLKQFLLENARFETKNFSQLNLENRMIAAVETLLRMLPDAAVGNLQKMPPEEILNGLLFARAILLPSENAADVKNIFIHNQSNLPAGFTLKDLRDLGALIKVLIADAGAAATVEELDLSVQKFVKILLANNEIGILMAAISLAGQPQNSKSLSNSLALVQIYQLVNQLLEAGQKLLETELNEVSAKNILQKDAKNNFLTLAICETNDKNTKTPEFRNLHQAENSLRQFLEFNPNFAHEKSISAFVNADDARHAQKHFSDVFQLEIEDWLKSGNHRFVKDLQLDKPIGIVVERGEKGASFASQMRIVLVRDNSAQSWHFLKSFLVREA